MQPFSHPSFLKIIKKKYNFNFFNKKNCNELTIICSFVKAVPVPYL